ncbi:MAG: LSU ribosomal protein L4p (L1e) [Candidatus Bipolaricaulis sibiricus]|uniref:Large ribosomal subunit protein uL4 n=1 Tax=Bipolaricaulis sibiricus TaxID=2501609 RepID=A0A410FTL4_BIPS1|nr:MAG: LSU ribosomal protein L4p (L1e) [Candidatus Bipolaricaulis sibiricus]
MPNVRMYRFNDAAAEPVEAAVSASVFGVPVSTDLLHRAVRVQLLNRRQGTAATKTRGEVSGGGRKPWAQKHTGRARHGSTRSPIWRHGGVTFGPQPREWSLGLPARMRRRALSAALSARCEAGMVWMIDEVAFERPRTKDAIALLARLSCPAKTLVVVAPDEHVVPVTKSFSNIPGVTCLRSDAVTVYDVLAHDGLLLTQRAVQALEERVSHG